MEGDLKQARHNLRGKLNALKLCVSALDMLRTRADLLEFLEMVDQSAQRVLTALDQFEAVADRDGNDPRPPAGS
jgi:hypothetical protein